MKNALPWILMAIAAITPMLFMVLYHECFAAWDWGSNDALYAACITVTCVLWMFILGGIAIWLLHKDDK